MRSRLLVAVLLIVTAVAGRAADPDDVVIDFKGEAIPARVLRFEDNVFTIDTTNGVRRVPVEDVTSIFFDINASTTSVGTPASTPLAPVAKPVSVAVTPAVTAAPAAAKAPTPRVVSPALPKRPARIPPPYGPAVDKVMANDLRTQGASFLGKVVKVEFHYRGRMQALPDGTMLASLMVAGDWNPLWVYIDGEAAKWFRELPETPAYLDRSLQKARGYYVYGVVVEGTPQLMVGMPQAVGTYTIQPIGRRTQRDLRGDTLYEW